jgi:hypothetical protein
VRQGRAKARTAKTAGGRIRNRDPLISRIKIL